MDSNIGIWNNMIMQGVEKGHVLQQACNHEGHLDALPWSKERDEAIKEVVVFIKALSKIIEDENRDMRNL